MLETKIIFGLIVMTIVGFILNMVSFAVGKHVEKKSNSKLVGMLFYMILIGVYYLWLITYWLGLYSESLE